MSDMLSECSDSDHEATSSWALSDASSTDCEDTLMTSSWALSDVSTDCEDLSEAPQCRSRGKKDEFLLHGEQVVAEREEARPLLAMAKTRSRPVALQQDLMAQSRIDVRIRMQKVWLQSEAWKEN